MDVSPVPDNGKNNDEVVVLVLLSNGALYFFNSEKLADFRIDQERLVSERSQSLTVCSPNVLAKTLDAVGWKRT